MVLWLKSKLINYNNGKKLDCYSSEIGREVSHSAYNKKKVLNSDLSPNLPEW